MTVLDKLITTTSSPGAEVVGKVIENSGKGSAVVGGVTYAAEKTAIIEPTYSLAEYAAIMSIIGGLVWIAKMLFDSFLNWLRYRRGD